MIITEKWLMQYTNGVPTKAQFALLGVKWPPTSGWLSRLVGDEINEEVKVKFERLHKSQVQELNTNLFEIQDDNETRNTN